jgi:putative oxidoreductase
MVMNKRWLNIFLQGIICLLIILWAYTSISKLNALTQFKQQLALQHFDLQFAQMLLWIIPGSEILATILLVIPKSRFYGLLLYFILMTAFTSYIGLALIGFYKNVPCSCGGVLQGMSWMIHFWFNLFFLAIAGVGLQLMRKMERNKLAC